jgi:hypothetical protein
MFKLSEDAAGATQGHGGAVQHDVVGKAPRSRERRGLGTPSTLSPQYEHERWPCRGSGGRCGR